MKKAILTLFTVLAMVIVASAQNEKQAKQLTPEESAVTNPKPKEPVLQQGSAGKVQEKVTMLEKKLNLSVQQKQQLTSLITAFYSEMDQLASLKASNKGEFLRKKSERKQYYMTEFSKNLDAGQKQKLEEFMKSKDEK